MLDLIAGLVALVVLWLLIREPPEGGSVADESGGAGR